MPAASPAVRAGFATLGRVAPRAALPLAHRAFFDPGPPAAVREHELEVHRAARRTTIAYRGGEVVSYAWGHGGRTAVLLHGWRSRASRFAAVTTALVDAGFTVRSFDAPAYGDSTGPSPSVLDILALVGTLEEQIPGGFDVVVGHSLGALAGLVAVREGLNARRVVALAPVPRFALLVDGFVRTTALPGRLAGPLTERIAAGLGTTGAELLTHFDTTAHALPAGVQLLVVHDAEDPQVPLHEAKRLVDAHGAGAELLSTTGLGHSRLLSGPEVVAAAADFLAAPVPPH